MSFKYRIIQTASNKNAVQIVQYKDGKRKIIEHIGTAQDKIHLNDLIDIAKSKISTLSNQLPLFSSSASTSKQRFDNLFQIQDHRYILLHETLLNIYEQLGLHQIDAPLLRDLSFARITKPSSKVEAVSTLEKYFDINYSINSVYKNFKHLQAYQYQVEEQMITYAKEKLKQDISILFYDVTTLYFESFSPDELRKLGFSKDNKFEQPQIVIGLLSTNIGFPVSYQLFNGKKFEGHTMIPIIKRFMQRHNTHSITVIADAAMISKDNISDLIQAELQYIVGARLSNIKKKYFDEINSLNTQQDQCTFSIKTHLGRLVVQFSAKRYRKDKYELEKSIERAKNAVKAPSKISTRYKYVKKDKNNSYSLNQNLIDKRLKLLGLKGYYTNTQLKNFEVIQRYKNLWRIEQNFRVFKSDMQVRPLYHWKPAAIQSHLLVCFIALCMSKLVEIKTDVSIKVFVKELMNVSDSVVKDKNTGDIFLARNTTVSEKLKQILTQLSTEN